ncbi:hypothetical protein Lalb_Chr01g0000311 [Lupinus albus]|uniref:Uncharacterized protein n=1 Tax=Lupinus albus TaxID=3870 RepID=A0A6A4R217_LUPAL|nr:hypothetical protein Lalb_Chr01g0000311 [Lupinus albus]
MNVGIILMRQPNHYKKRTRMWSLAHLHYRRDQCISRIKTCVINKISMTYIFKKKIIKNILSHISNTGESRGI